MTKNPFSFYDFLGYLFPGMVSLFLIIFVTHLKELYGSDIPIEKYFSLTEFLKAVGSVSDFKWWEFVIIVIISYVLGHIVSYLSSLIVEYFVNRIYGYPSYYLLHSTKEMNLEQRLKKYFEAKRRTGVFRAVVLFIIRLVILLVMLPMLVLLIFKEISWFITRPLDAYIRDSIQRKLTNLSKTLDLTLPDVNSETDYHRIVMHYVYLNIPNSQRKADNYVAIYGFLRAMTLIACLFFIYLLYEQISIIELCGQINWPALGLLGAMFILCNVLFMGFAKFYRRFTLENYMALLTEKESKQ